MSEPPTTPDPTTQPDPAPPMSRRLASPIVLRITDAEILESQLPDDDLSALGVHVMDSSSDSSGGPSNPVKCQGYEKCDNYSNAEVM